MLSRKQQLFLMCLLKGKSTRKQQDIYKSLAFYRNISYMKKNNLVRSRRIRDDSLENVYILTIKGEIIARILAGLSSSPEEYRKHAII